MWRARWSVSVIGLLLCPVTAPAGSGDILSIDPVKVRLISSVDKITPGVPITLGVSFVIEKGWHVYWKYAGDAGLPPKITWQLPAGWKVGEIQWPLPQRFIEKGPLTTYGYSDSVVLLVEVTPPASTPPSKTTLQAKVKWLVCHDECIPGGADVGISFPTRKQDIALNARSIRRWQEQIPRAMSESGISTTATTKDIDSTGRSAALVLTVKTGPEQSVPIDWFPAPTSDFVVKDISITKIAEGIQIVCEVHSYRKPLVEIGTLESLVIGSVNGIRIGMTFVASLKDGSS